MRFALAYIAITLAALLALNLFAAATTRLITFKAQEKSLSGTARSISTAVANTDDFSAAAVQTVMGSLGYNRTTRAIVADPYGVALYDSLAISPDTADLVLFPEVVQALKGYDVFYSNYRNAVIESRYAMPIVRNGETRGVVYLMDYDTDQGTIIADLQRNILRISFALAGGIALFSILFSFMFSKRLRTILASIRQMREGNYSNTNTLKGHDEVAQLSREFNTLAERLGASEERRRQFVSDASHELKTPLASIKLLSDSILQNDMDQVTEHEFIADIGREADRLGRLTQKLLTLTKLDAEITQEREIIDAEETVSKVSRMLVPIAEQRNISFHTECQDGCYILSVEDDFYQIVFNLAENAIKYNRDNGWVHIGLKRAEEDVILTISDNGVGIPEDSLPHIFERFYRVDKARSRAAGGSGLGLSIVHTMVTRNFSTIQVSPRDGGGTVFTVTIPLFDPGEEENK